ncbi:MAG: hypothetical protein M1820_004988 [Bogoriella megaspora]|nr:MAG: hypothetical protein M1820_004988 [Bogoriella megaspora]
MVFETRLTKSSKVTKTAKKNPIKALRRSSSGSPFTNAPRRKPNQGPNDTNPKQLEVKEIEHEETLEDLGIVTSLPTDRTVKGVVDLIQYIKDRTFSDVPERASGMNSARTAEVLNFRLNMPPIVSIAHIYALSPKPTAVERETNELLNKGTLRKISITGRGSGAATYGDGLVLIEDWENMVKENKQLNEDTKTKYLEIMHDNPTALTIAGSKFAPNEVTVLVSAGFLTASHSTKVSDFLRPGATFALANLSSAGSTAASGSLAAVGGTGVIHSTGGGGRGLNFDSNEAVTGQTYAFSLPNTGSYLKLLVSARQHLLSLLSKPSPRHREAPLNNLHERWDGGIAADDPASRARAARGESFGVLPGRTKKWRSFWGVRFEWVLEEAVGGGLAECFNTGSVGVGVRAL